MPNNCFRTISRITHGPRTLKAPCLATLKLQSTTRNQQVLRLGTSHTVRSLNIRHVAVGSPSTATAQSKEQTLGIPSRSPRGQKLKNLHKDIDFQAIDVDAWLNTIPLPPDTYWDRWGSVLSQSDKPGALRVKKLLGRWHEELATLYRTQRHSVDKQREIVQCTGRFHMPLLGERTVLAYGYTRKEAINNLYPVLTSTMYKSGELDTVFEGTAASRKLIAIYEQAAEYGLYPRFKLSMSNDQPGAHYQITLSVPEWNVKVLASAPRYVEALSEAIDSYQEKVKKRDVKQKISPDVTASRMKDLKAATAYHALNYILRKLNIKNLGKQYDQLKTAGPQHKYSIRINGKLANADVPMIRRDDAPRLAWLTAAVTILQRYGFDAMDGFSEHFVANKPPKPEPTRPRVKPDTQAASQFRPSLPEQRAIDQPGQDADSKDGHLMGHLYGSLKEGLEEDAAEGMSDAQDRGSRHGVRYSWHK